MIPNNGQLQEPTIFCVTITPHRSLGRGGFIALMLVFGGISFVAGMVFLIAGAWPVFGFFGLDVLLVYWAFRANYGAARIWEEVTVTPSELTVRRASHRGQIAQWTLNPLWTRLDAQTHAEFGVERLFLVSHGRKLPIAAFLGPDEKKELAAALNTALGEAKRGVTRSAVG
jgi:uncharacterized membrane protein